MKYIHEFRNRAAAGRIATAISELSVNLNPERTIRIMEVCGTHTMAIARYAINNVLPDNVEVISGPGCPVCVTDPGYIDAAIELARKGCIITTFGDMINVPGTSSTLAECRAEGGKVEICYSPEKALSIADDNPDKEVVFLAIGFETTIPPVTSIARLAEMSGAKNISLLTAFKLIPPGLSALVQDPELQIDAFLCPAHVSAIIGTAPYQTFARDYAKPCVIAGFEPLDILYGIEGILRQITEGKPMVENQYSRVVKPGGNPTALALMEVYLEPCNAWWRGLGQISNSGMKLRKQFDSFDASKRHNIGICHGKLNPQCLCGEVIKGKIKPVQCPMFATVCTPDRPMGPCMVSQEGSCAASFKYSR